MRSLSIKWDGCKIFVMISYVDIFQQKNEWIYLAWVERRASLEEVKSWLLRGVIWSSIPRHSSLAPLCISIRNEHQTSFRDMNGKITYDLCHDEKMWKK